MTGSIHNDKTYALGVHSGLERLLGISHNCVHSSSSVSPATPGPETWEINKLFTVLGFYSFI